MDTRGRTDFFVDVVTGLNAAAFTLASKVATRPGGLLNISYQNQRILAGYAYEIG